MKLVTHVLRFTLGLLRVLILAAIILIATFVVAIDKMSPNGLISILPILLMLDAIFIIALLKLRIPLPNNLPKGKELDNIMFGYVNRHRVQILPMVVAFFIVMSLPRVVSNYVDLGIIKDSLMHFDVTSTPAVSHDRVNITRSSLEKSFRLIGSYANVSVGAPIEVHVYSDALEFQNATGSSKSTFALIRWSVRGPEIYLPAELPPDKKAILNDGAVVHELTHAIEFLITKNPRSVPLYVTEGLANQHLALWERVLTHVDVWLERDKIMSYDQISLFRYDYPKDETQLGVYYSTSYEFVRYLVMQYKETALWDVIHQVGNGVSYNTALLCTTGKTEKELYDDWLKTWLLER